MNRSEMLEHPGAPRIVERAGQLTVSLRETAKDVPVALVIRPRGILYQAAEFFKDALAEPLERHLA